ncbi:MAG: hypothetical protein DRO01_03175, partial [Thermoproteota archaeon]
MTIKVAPDNPRSTHHFSLADRFDNEIGFLVCDSNGNVPKELAFASNAQDRTSFKQTSGNLSLDSFEYPYTPIAQDDWSGGRGSLEFERDTTKYLDGYRVRTSIANKVFLGPQEQFSRGYRELDQSVQGNTDFHILTGQALQAGKRFAASASYTAAKIFLLLRRRGEPNDLTVAIHNDSGGLIGTMIDSVILAQDSLEDILSEWVVLEISAALTGGSYYWLTVSASNKDDNTNHWEVGVKPGEDSTYYSDDDDYDGLADFDLLYRITDKDVAGTTVIPFEYKEQQYCVVSPSSGAPEIWMSGDRGAADANTGQLDKLIDGTKSWKTNQWKGAVVVVVDGMGETEPINYRVIVSNDATRLYVDGDWTITQNTTTEYVIVGADDWRSMGSCGLMKPITDVMITTKGIVYFAMGSGVYVRRLRAFNDSGTWRDFDDAAKCQANDGTNQADFIIEAELQSKIYKILNRDPSMSNDVTYATSDLKDWGVNLDFGSTAKRFGSKYRRATGIIIYQDAVGSEAVWMGKVDKPYIAVQSGDVYPFPFEEMGTVQSRFNFKVSLKRGFYLFFSLGDEGRIQRWNDGKLDDIGPSQGEGLPENRRGPVVDLLGYPGEMLCAVDAGDDGYSSVLEERWHELYRAPKGERIKAIHHQHVPGAMDRLWVWQGNDMIWLPSLPLSNELENSGYRFTHEAALEDSRKHAGLLDTVKLAKYLKLASDRLGDDTWIEVDFRVDDETAWTSIDEQYTRSPIERKLVGSRFGVAGTRLMLRYRLCTKDATLTPILTASILEAVSRIGQKDLYSFSVLVEDDQKDMLGD